MKGEGSKKGNVALLVTKLKKRENLSQTPQTMYYQKKRSPTHFLKKGLIGF